jgi:Fe2+ transport system protein FeoA
MASATIPLGEAETGTKATVVAFRGGGDFQARVTSMGLFVGCRLEVLIGGGGRVIVAVGDTRIALGHGMAEKVIVRPLSK